MHISTFLAIGVLASCCRAASPDTADDCVRLKKAAFRYARHHFGSENPRPSDQPPTRVEAILLTAWFGERDSVCRLAFADRAAIAPGQWFELAAYGLENGVSEFHVTLNEGVGKVLVPLRHAQTLPDSLGVTLTRARGETDSARGAPVHWTARPIMLCRFMFWYEQERQRGCNPTACELFVDSREQVLRAVETAVLCAD